MTDEHPNDEQERGPFFVVNKRGRHVVMSEPEIMEDESVQLASGRCDTRQDAEDALAAGVSDGTYKS